MITTSPLMLAPLLLALCLPAHAQTPPRSSAIEWLQQAIASDPALATQRATLDAARAAEDAASAGLGPELTLSGQRGRSRRTSADRLPWVPEAHSLPAAGHTLTLSQLLYDGQRTQATVNAAQARVQQEQERLRRRLNERLLAMREALHNEEAAAARLHHARDALRDMQSLNTLVQQKHDAGLVALADVRRAQSRLLDAQRGVTEAQARWQEARLTLAGETGLPVPTFAPDHEPFVALDSAELDALGLACAQACPEVREASLQVDRAQAELRAAEAAWHPRLSLELSNGESHNLSGNAEQYRSASAFLKLNWTFYDGGLRTAQTRRLGHEMQAQEQTLEETRRTVQTRWSVGRSRLQASVELYGIALRNASVARQARELAEQGLRAGLRSPIEVADTVNEETRALYDAATRDAERRLGQDRLLALTGLLARHLGLAEAEP